MAILAMSLHGQDARATPPCGMAILAMSGHGQDARATPLTRPATLARATPHPFPILQAGADRIGKHILHLAPKVILIPNQVVVGLGLPELSGPSNQTV